jgi:hypothetical protein
MTDPNCTVEVFSDSLYWAMDPGWNAKLKMGELQWRLESQTTRLDKKWLRTVWLGVRNWLQ